MAKLGDICEIKSGGTPSRAISEYWNGDIPWVKISDFNSKYIDYTSENITDLGLEKSSAKMVQAGSILFTIFATLGEVAILNINATTNQAIAALTIKNFDVDRDYLYYFLVSLKGYINEIGRGVAQNNINMSILKNLEVPLLPIETQKQIAENLDKVTRLIDLCNAILEKLDLLVKARFVEMFGDPVSNAMRWKTKTLRELTSKIGSGATPKGGKESYRLKGISLIRSMNVHNGRFEYKDLAHISDEQAEKLDNVTIEINDVLLNITGASVARCCIVPNEVLPARVNQHVCIVRCKKEINSVFLNHMLIDEKYQNLLWSIAGSGATREAITKQQVENLTIIMPPIDLQDQFADFVKQTDKSKSAVKQVLEKAETLKKALMQKYFG